VKVRGSLQTWPRTHWLYPGSNLQALASSSSFGVFSWSEMLALVMDPRWCFRSTPQVTCLTYRVGPHQSMSIIISQCCGFRISEVLHIVILSPMLCMRLFPRIQRLQWSGPRGIYETGRHCETRMTCSSTIVEYIDPFLPIQQLYWQICTSSIPYSFPQVTFFLERNLADPSLPPSAEQPSVIGWCTPNVNILLINQSAGRVQDCFGRFLKEEHLMFVDTDSYDRCKDARDWSPHRSITI
jgi:hypothetical protein